LFIFDEKVRSMTQTFLGIFFLISGLVGMTHFSAPEREIKPMVILDNDIEAFNFRESLMDGMHKENDDDPSSNPNEGFPNVTASGEKDMHIQFLGIKFQRYTLGILGAASDGFLGGSALVPMHYSNDGGIEYVLSFGIGAAIITFLGWLLRLAYNTHKTGSIKDGWNNLPSMHFRTLWLQGCTAGTLWSIGNIGNILSVTYLGEGIGMSVVQCAMMVSGLWGILYFREIKGTTKIMGWSMSAILTIASIAFVGHEHRKS